MPILVKDFIIEASVVHSEMELKKVLAEKLGTAITDITSIKVLKRSLDARKKRNLLYHYQIEFCALDEKKLLDLHPLWLTHSELSKTPHPLNMSNKRRTLKEPVIIIGSGPAGQSAAFLFAEAQIPTIIVERGQPVEQRIKDVGRLQRRGELNEESNYCYGEGGAGTFSDGKLTCGRRHPLIRYLFETWVRFGAPEDILYEAHPHIGTDYLLKMTKNMRLFIEQNGGQFLFGKRLVDIAPGRSAKMAVTLSDGQVLESDHVILAIGHSARDTYRLLQMRNIAMQPKPFAMGVRVEHPQELIDEIQYGTCHQDLGVHAAEYKLVAHTENRGIWTFCMCPGGHLLPTSAQAGHLAINGMSYHARNSGFANAALVVNILREDFYQGDVLDGVRFQEDLEQAAFKMGGGSYACPAQRLEDFIAARPSVGELKSTYRPKVNPGRLDQLLPKYVVSALQAALVDYNRRMRGFINSDALIVGLESKTSAPIMMPRNELFQSISHAGLYPCGEGAGFAGGIVSAALDGLRIAQSIIEHELSENITLDVSIKA